MVCAPGRAHQRLTPSNCDAAAVRRRAVGRERQARPLRLRHQDARPRRRSASRCTTCSPRPSRCPRARSGSSTTRSCRTRSGLGFVDELRSYLEGLDDRDLAETLIGGLSTYEFPESIGGKALQLVKEAAGATEYLLPPLPNTLYTRDTTCWIYGGVHAQPAVLAGAPRGDDPHHGDLQVPPGLRRQGERLVGRPDRGPRARRRSKAAT